MKSLFIMLTIGLSLSQPLTARDNIRVGSKTFTEAYVLAEIFSQIIENEFPEVPLERKHGLGGTGVLFNALKSGDLDFYHDYTGTIAEAMLKNPNLKSIESIRRELSKINLSISDPLGFNNTYAIAIKRKTSKKLKLTKISELKNRPELVGGFTYEFIKRKDGFNALAKFYGFKLKKAEGMEHSLSYQAIEKGSIDIIDAYSTDAKLKQLDLVALEDDRSFFPQYKSVIIANSDFVKKHPQVWKRFKDFEGKINEQQMIDLNSMVDLDKKTFASVASHFLTGSQSTARFAGIQLQELYQRSLEHLYLVFVALFASILFGIPMGILASRTKWLGQILLGFSGLVQTIPSLALLCFFIPLFGIGTLPALAALFLYGLLPIVRNTYVGILSIDGNLKEASYIIGLSAWERTKWIELPLASQSILAGIKTSAIISVGTATLAAFIGAGGYGSFIVTGLALNDTSMILHGAIPAAVLAILMQILFELSERAFVPKGLKIHTQQI